VSPLLARVQDWAEYLNEGLDGTVSPELKGNPALRESWLTVAESYRPLAKHYECKLSGREAQTADSRICTLKCWLVYAFRELYAVTFV
jgi:hypothetical protein